jgi:predicted dehydrogenase
VAAIVDTLGGESIDVEDTAALSLSFSNGMIGTLHCSYVIDKWPHQLFFALRGTDGWVRWDGHGPEIEVRSTRPEWATAPTRIMRFDPEPVSGYEGAVGIETLRRFIASFRDGARAVVSVEDALRVLEVLDAVHESARTGRRVAPVRAVDSAGKP